MQCRRRITGIQVKSKLKRAKKNAVNAALHYELCSYQRPRRTNYGLEIYKNFAVVVRDVITKLPFSLLLCH